MSSSYSLGIEFSTQSVKLVVLDLNSNGISFTDSFNYDQAFPEYKTEGGVLPSPSEETRHTSPFMLIEAVDLAFKRLSESDINMSLIKAIKCDGMQHCTVYVNALFKKTLSRLDPEQELLNQIKPCISRPASPIWEDRSTSKEAQYLADALKSEGGILNITGNRAELRFPASQILKWARENPEEYEETSSIFILSAFITSILTGKISPVDTGDGWGSNLNNLDIDNPGWSDKVISAMDQYLDESNIKSSLYNKLGRIDHYDAGAGTINLYFSEKYRMYPDTIILTGTGDNPATLMGCGGKIVISLGSSYTVNGVMGEIVPSKNEEYNLFGYTKGKAMALSVITNGAKVQDQFLKEYLLAPDERPADSSDWQEYIKMAGDSLLSNEEKILLPYLLDESVPLRKKGIRRDNFTEESGEENIRALILSQVLSLKLHSDHLGEAHELCVVGGGARNSLMMQWIADAFDVETYTIENFPVAAPLGCAISAAVKLLNISYEETATRFVRKDPSSVKKPIPENVKKMQRLVKRYHELENRNIQTY
ncbi:FGGY-family carbohydrate kinase [Thermodesulfobacteriota bacterium]